MIRLIGVGHEDVGDLDDVRVVDQVDRLRLDEQSIDDGADDALAVDDLHRGPAPDPRVLDLEHAARRPEAELPDEAIGPDRLTDDRRAAPRDTRIHAV